MQGSSGRRQVSAKEAVEAIRGPLSNSGLMEKFKITTRGFADLLTQLLLNNLITQEDLEKRGIRYKMQKKRSAAIASDELDASAGVSSEMVMDIAVITETVPVEPLDELSFEQEEILLDSSVITEVVTLQPLDEPPAEQEKIHEYFQPPGHRDDVFLDTSALAEILSSGHPESHPRVRKERVTVRFIPGAAHVVSSRLLHPAQKILKQRDGTLTTAIEVVINRDLVCWVLGFGAIAEVLEPDFLREMIHDELKAAAAKYESSNEQSRRQAAPAQAGAEAAKPLTGLVDFWKIDRK